MLSGYIIDEGGNKSCPTDICKAVCCKATHFRPDKKPPCEYLTAKLNCELHNVGGVKCKPLGCYEYPRSQADINAINLQAEKEGFSERCQLEFK